MKVSVKMKLLPKLISLFLGILTLLLLHPYSLVFAQGGGPAGIPQIEYIFARIVCVSVPLGFVALLVFLVVAGFKYLISGGEPKAVQAAHQTFAWSLLGVLFLAIAWLILLLIQNFTGVEVTRFTLASLPGVQGFTGSCWTPAPVVPEPSPSQPTTPTGNSCLTNIAGNTCTPISTCTGNKYVITCPAGTCESYNTNSELKPVSCDIVFPVPIPHLDGTIVETSLDEYCDIIDPSKKGAVVCIKKPVIYLYPETDTYVNISLSIPGIITKSIPQYEINGWQQVLAHPGGSLEYKNGTYSELFYESQVSNIKKPSNGIIIPKNELPTKLAAILLRLGLNTAEQEEFLAYWMPKLADLKGNYIVFSIFEPSEKARIDGVHIIPAPDTRIEFMAYFKPLESPVKLKPLVLPENPPERIGFTEVEWGGTIDY